MYVENKKKRVGIAAATKQQYKDKWKIIKRQMETLFIPCYKTIRHFKLYADKVLLSLIVTL